jgi:hypothetical protein
VAHLPHLSSSSVTSLIIPVRSSSLRRVMLPEAQSGSFSEKITPHESHIRTLLMLSHILGAYLAYPWIVCPWLEFMFASCHAGNGAKGVDFLEPVNEQQTVGYFARWYRCRVGEFPEHVVDVHACGTPSTRPECGTAP